MDRTDVSLDIEVHFYVYVHGEWADTQRAQVHVHLFILKFILASRTLAVSLWKDWWPLKGPFMKHVEVEDYALFI